MSGLLHLVTAWFHATTLREILTSAVDILVVYYAIYRALLLVKGTRAAQMLIGLVLVVGGFFLARVFELTTVLWLLDNLINYSIIFVIVIFQNDIRRALSRVGANLFASRLKYEETYVFEEVIQAAELLARAKVGALFVFEREAELDEFLGDPGERVDGRVTKELLVALFLPEPINPLHDGAVLIKNLRVERAGCVLPLSASRKLDKSLGTRHRAAVGITEETDAVVVVVSEERGAVSLCFGGNIAHDLDSASLRKALLGLFQKDQRRSRKPKRAVEQTSESAASEPRPAAQVLAHAPLTDDAGGGTRPVADPTEPAPAAVTEVEL